MFNTDVMFSACFHTQLAEYLNAQLVDIEGLLCICLFVSIYPSTRSRKHTCLYVAPLTPYIFIWAIIGSIRYVVFGTSVSHILIPFISNSRPFKLRRLSYYSIR